MAVLKCIRQKNRSFCTSFRSFSLDRLKSSSKTSEAESSSSSRRANEIYDFMKSIEAEHLFKKVPVYYFEKKVRSKYLLINPFIARKISSALKLYLNEGYVLESDPGFGLLSKEILPVVSYLRLYEEDLLLRSDLRGLQEKHPKKVDIFDASLQAIHKLQLEDSVDNGARMALLFDGIPTDVKLSMIMMTPFKRFISSWIQHILKKKYFSKFPHLDFYFFIPPSIFTRLIASPQNDYYPRYQRFSVLAQTLFDIKLLMNDIPRKAFLPWPKKSITRQEKSAIENYENDHEVMYFVKMSVKTESLIHLQDESVYHCFFTFVAQNMMGKKRIVPYFEKIIPGSGAKVIMMGYNTYSTFNELNPNEIFSLFLQFTQWPEFQHCSFYSYWKNQSVIDENDASMDEIVDPLQSHEKDLHEEVDNDDETFLIGKDVK